MSKYTARQVAEELLSQTKPSLVALVRAAASGLPIRSHLLDLTNALESEIERLAPLVLISPYSNVSDSEWLEAFEEASQLVYEQEDAERDPRRDEVDLALELQRERHLRDRGGAA
jgi:hypothetical protein